MPGSLSGVKAGRAFIVIDAVDKTGTILRRVGTKIRRWGAELNRYAHRLIQAMVLLMTPIALSVAGFVKFDDAMRRVQARTGATADEMAKLRGQARQLGRDTASSATEIANLQAVLGQKGFKASDILEMTPHIRNLAQAAGKGSKEDVMVAATLVSGLLKAFRMPATETQRIADMMTVAVNNSNFALSELVNSMSEAGTIASIMNMSLEETVATLALMRDLNIAPQKAGVAVKTMYTRLAKESGREKFNRDLQAMTGRTVEFADAMNNLKPLPQILFEIAMAIRGTGTMDELGMLADLFGTRGILGAGAFKDNLPAFETFMNQLINLDNNAAKTASIMESGLGGSLRRVWGHVVELTFSLSEALEPELLNLENTIKGMLTAAATWIAKNRELVVSIVAILAKILAYGVALKVLAMAVWMVGWAISLLGIAVRGLSLAFGLLVIASSGLMLIASTVAFLAGQFLLWMDFVLFTFANMSLGAILAAGTISGVFVGAGILIVGAFLTMSTAAADAFAGVLEGVSTIGGAFTSLFSTINQGFADVATALRSGDIEFAGRIAAMGLEIAFKEAFIEIEQGIKRIIESLLGFSIKFGEEGLFGTGLFANQELLGTSKIFEDWQEGIEASRESLRGLKQEYDELVNGNALGNALVEAAVAGIQGVAQQKEKTEFRMNLDNLAGSASMGTGRAVTAMQAMESRQRETVLEIAKLRLKGFQEPLDRLNATAQDQLAELEEINDNLEGGGVAVVGP